MNRISLLALVLPMTLTVAGCRNDNGSTTPINSHDMSASSDGGGTAGDMAVPVGAATTIAAARAASVRTSITVTAVVTAVHGDSEWYVQDAAGGIWSGIDVFCNKSAKKNPCPASVTTPVAGDIVAITGVISPYKGKDELDPSAQTKMSSGATLPPVTTVSAADAAATQAKPELRGILVNVTPGATPWSVDDVMPTALYNSTSCPGSTDGGCVMCLPPAYGGFEVTDGTTKIYIYNYFYGTSHLASSPECLTSATTNVPVTASSTFTTLGGILDVDPYAPTANTVVLAPAADSSYTIH
jgi:uncharacterized protein YdeI (BOF family)